MVWHGLVGAVFSTTEFAKDAEADQPARFPRKFSPAQEWRRVRKMSNQHSEAQPFGVPASKEGCHGGRLSTAGMAAGPTPRSAYLRSPPQ